MSQIRIRPMSEADFDASAEIVAQNPLWERYKYGAQEAHNSFANAIGQKESRLLVAERGEEVVGFAWYMPSGGFARAGYLRLIGVSPTHQSSGIGRMLLQAVEEGCPGRMLMLLVADFNEDAKKFYLREGYRQAGSFEEYVIEGVNEILLWKKFPKEDEALPPFAQTLSTD